MRRTKDKTVSSMVSHPIGASQLCFFCFVANAIRCDAVLSVCQKPSILPNQRFFVVVGMPKLLHAAFRVVVCHRHILILNHSVELYPFGGVAKSTIRNGLDLALALAFAFELDLALALALALAFALFELGSPWIGISKGQRMVKQSSQCFRQSGVVARGNGCRALT